MTFVNGRVLKREVLAEELVYFFTLILHQLLLASCNSTLILMVSCGQVTRDI